MSQPGAAALGHGPLPCFAVDLGNLMAIWRGGAKPGRRCVLVAAPSSSATALSYAGLLARHFLVGRDRRRRQVHDPRLRLL